jgi:hypothetical protein
MTANDILIETARLGITLKLCDGKLHARPLSAVTPALAALMRANKRELFALLRERELAPFPGAKLVQLTLPARARPAAVSTEPVAVIIEACEHAGVMLWLDNDRLVLGHVDRSGKEPGIAPKLALEVEARAGEIVGWLKALRRPLELPTEEEPLEPVAPQMHGTPYRVRMDEFGNCDICGEPAAMVNFCGRFCSLKCFRLWQRMPEAEVLADAVTLDPAVEAELTRIWPLAEVLGWSHERIWNAHFWPNTPEHPRGLAAVLHPGDEPEPPDSVAEVTRDYLVIERTEILLVKVNGVITRHERKTWMRFPKDPTLALAPLGERPASIEKRSADEQ